MWKLHIIDGVCNKYISTSLEHLSLIITDKHIFFCHQSKQVFIVHVTKIAAMKAQQRLFVREWNDMKIGTILC